MGYRRSIMLGWNSTRTAVLPTTYTFARDIELMFWFSFGGIVGPMMANLAYWKDISMRNPFVINLELRQRPPYVIFIILSDAALFGHILSLFGM